MGKEQRYVVCNSCANKVRVEDAHNTGFFYYCATCYNTIIIFKKD